MSNFLKSANKRQYKYSLFIGFLTATICGFFFISQDIRGKIRTEEVSTDLQVSSDFCEPLKVEVSNFMIVVAERRSSMRQDLLVSSNLVSSIYKYLEAWEGKSLKAIPADMNQLAEQARLLVSGADAIFAMAEEDDSRSDQWQKIWKACGSDSKTKEKLELFRERNYEHLSTTAETLSQVGVRVLDLISTYESWAKKSRYIELGDFDELEDIAKGLYEAHVLVDENYNFAVASLLMGSN